MGMPASTERTKRWTADEARALTAANALLTPRYEVIDGELLVTPSPNRHHQAAVARLVVTLDAYTRAQRVGHTLPSPFDVELAPDTTVQPDVFVLPPSEWGPKTDPGRARALLLAVEVVSPTSARVDRTTKRRPSTGSLTSTPGSSSGGGRRRAPADRRAPAGVAARRGRRLLRARLGAVLRRRARRGAAASELALSGRRSPPAAEFRLRAGRTPAMRSVHVR
jgi:hypothetical protein